MLKNRALDKRHHRLEGLGARCGRNGGGGRCVDEREIGKGDEEIRRTGGENFLIGNVKA